MGRSLLDGTYPPADLLTRARVRTRAYALHYKVVFFAFTAFTVLPKLKK